MPGPGRRPCRPPTTRSSRRSPAGTDSAKLAKDGGVAVGAGCRRRHARPTDGRPLRRCRPYVQPPTGPGVFQPIASTPPVDTKLPFVRPFTFSAPSEYRPDAPYALTSARYAADASGGAGRTVAPAAPSGQQSRPRPSRFYSGSHVQAVQPGHARPRQRGRPRSARVGPVARLHLGGGRRHDDRLLGSEVPVHVLRRPNQAIGLADADGNPATSPEVGWTPLVTGNHPEYPSGHSCFTAAVLRPPSTSTSARRICRRSW